MRTALLLFVASMIAVSCSAQLKKQRLIARSYYYDTGSNGSSLVLDDSVFFKYSGSRGSRFNESIMDYFDPRLLVDGSEIMRQESLIKPNNIDSDFSTSSVRFDTMWFYTFNPNYGKLLERMETCEYSTDGRPTNASHTYFSIEPNSYEFRYFAKYDWFNDDLFKVEVSYETPETPKTISEERLIFRDPKGNVLIDSSSADKDAVHFTYDDQGRYVSKSGGYWRGAGFIDYPYPSFYEYNPDGRVRKRTEMKMSSDGRYKVDGYDTFVYNSGLRGYATRIFYTVSSDNKAYEYWRYSSHINQLGLKDTVVEQWYGGPQTQYFAVEYNSYGNPVSVTSYTVNDSTFGNYSKTYYYYELYEEAAWSNPYTASIFPNPTNGLIKLNFANGILPPLPINIQITNIAGQLVYSEFMTIKRSTTDVHFGSQHAPGVYAIRITGSNNEEVYKGMILKY